MRLQRIVLPGYTYLQEVVRRALANERHRLTVVLSNATRSEESDILNRLLRDNAGLHEITSIKHQPRDFSYKQLLSEVNRGRRIRELFVVSKRVINEAALSAESVRYYASLVDFYTVYKLKRMTAEAVYLYLLCFIHDRYQRLNDNLLNAFCTLVSRYGDEATAAAKESILRHRLEANDDLTQGGKILELFLNPDIPDETPFVEMKHQAAQLLAPDRLARLCQHLAHDVGLDESAYEWAQIDIVMRKAKRNLRPLLRFISLEGTTANQLLLTAFHAMSKAFIQGHQLPVDAIPLRLIPQRTAKYVVKANGTLIRDRVEFVLYRLLRERLEAGDLYCPDSARYRSLEDDLVDDDVYAKRDKLLPQLGVVGAGTSIKAQLSDIRSQLDERLERVNQRIRAGDNAFVRLREGRLVWTRGRNPEPVLRHKPFFDAIKRIDIDNLLLFVDRKTHFLDAFEHVLERYPRAIASP